MKQFKKVILTAAISVPLALSTLPAFSNSTDFPVLSQVSIVASAAPDLSSDMVKNPSKYFEFSSNNDGTTTLTRYIGSATSTIRIPAYVYNSTTKKNERIVKVGSGNYRIDFYKDYTVRNSITKVIVEPYVKEIGSYVFNNCNNLTTVELPYTITKIGASAFSGNPRLTKVSISTTPTFGSGVFSGCTNLKNAISSANAYTLLTAGADIQTINGSPIVVNKGDGVEPYVDPVIKRAFSEHYDILEGTKVLDQYLKLYSKYLVKNKMGITNYTPDVQKAEKIFDYVKSTVSYDSAAFHYVYDSQNRLIGSYNDVNNRKCHSAGSIFFSSKAVCEGYSKGSMYLFDAAGILGYDVSVEDVYANVYKNGSYTNEKLGSGHAFNIIKIEGKYFIFDLTNDKKKGFLVSGPMHVKNRSLGSIGTWSVSNSAGNPVKYSWTSLLNNKRGDLDFSGKIDVNDQNMLSRYISGNTATKNSILSEAKVSKALFEALADMDLNKKLDTNDVNSIHYGFDK